MRYNNSEEIVEYIIAIFTKDDKFAGILLANNNIAVTYYTDEIYNVTGQETNEIKETYNWYEYGENGFEQTEQYKGKCVVSIDDFSKCTDWFEKITSSCCRSLCANGFCFCSASGRRTLADAWAYRYNCVRTVADMGRKIPGGKRSGNSYTIMR